MLRNAEKCREMRRNVKNAEKCIEMQRNSEKCIYAEISS